MMLTWKDAVSTLFMGAVVAVYLAFLNGTHLWLISSARGTTVAVLVLGFVGGCVLGAAGDMFEGAKSGPVRIYLAFATLLGVAALAVAVTGLVTGSTIALAALVVLTISLWVISTVRHTFTLPVDQARGRATHSAINPGRPAHR